MANIVVVSTTNTIQVDFGAYSTELEEIKGTWHKQDIVLLLRATLVEIDIPHEKNWLLSHNGSAGTFQVDLVDGLAPTSLDDLYTKIQAIIQ